MLNWNPQKVENPKPKRIFTRFFISDPLIFWRECSFSLFPSKETIYAIARLPPPPPPPNTKAHTLDKNPHQHTGLTETTCKNAVILTAQSLTVESEGNRGQYTLWCTKKEFHPFFRLQNSQEILSPFFSFYNYIQCIDIGERKCDVYEVEDISVQKPPFQPQTNAFFTPNCSEYTGGMPQILLFNNPPPLHRIGEKNHPCFTPIHPYQQHL